MSKRSKNDESVSKLIKSKMRVLSDFGICNREDEKMIAELEQAIKTYPNKPPREALDYYCRPMIQKVVNSWK